MPLGSGYCSVMAEQPAFSGRQLVKHDHIFTDLQTFGLHSGKWRSCNQRNASGSGGCYQAQHSVVNILALEDRVPEIYKDQMLSGITLERGHRTDTVSNKVLR